MKFVLPPLFKNRKPMFWVGVGLCAAVVVLLAVIWWPDEGFGGGPICRGRTASEWFSEVSYDEGSTNKVEAFRSMGRDGVLFLAQILKMPAREKLGRAIYYKYGPGPRLSEALVRVLDLREDMDEPRRRAAWILSQLGPAAEPALPEMLQIFRLADQYDPATQPICDALQSMPGKLAFMVPELIQGLTNTSLEYATACAELLGAIGPNARQGLPALLNATNSSGRLAQSVAFALWDIDRQTNVVVEVLNNALKFQSRNRMEALKGLQRRGVALKAAAPLVRQALYDPNEAVRNEAERTLQQIDPERLQAIIDELNRNAPRILQQSIAVVQSGQKQNPSHAFTVIQFFGPKAESAVPVLIDILDEKPPARTHYFGSPPQGQTRLLALKALAAIGPAAREAVPALTNLLVYRDQYTVDYLNVLGAIGPDADKAIPVVEALLNVTNEGVRRRAGLSSSYRMITGPNDTVRFAAARALVEIAPGQASDAVNFLKRVEKERAPEWSWGPSLSPFSAQVALWKGGMEKNPPVTNLVALLAGKADSSRRGSRYNSIDPGVKLAAIQLLGEVGPQAHLALPLLESFLKVDESFRWEATIAIQRIDPQEAARLGLPGLLLAY